jgi:parvulin-like peptidyl-prolyl isomerase
MKNKLILLIIIIFMAAFPAFSIVRFSSAKPSVKPQVKPKHTAVKPAVKQPVEWAAKVNGDTISMDLFNRRVDAAMKEISKNTSIEAADEQALLQDTRKSILEQMIEAVILLQWAEREGLEIKDKAVNARIAEMKKSFPSKKEFYQSLEDQGMTMDDLERDTRKQLVVEKLMAMKAKTMAVSDEEIKAFYDKNTDLYFRNEKIRLKQVFMKDLRDIQTEKQNLHAGDKFIGEDIGAVEKGQLPVYDDSQIFELKKNGISDITSGEAGYYMFKVVEKIPAKQTKLEDIKDNIRKFILSEKARTQFQNDLQEEKANAKIILNEKLGKLF